MIIYLLDLESITLFSLYFWLGLGYIFNFIVHDFRLTTHYYLLARTLRWSLKLRLQTDTTLTKVHSTHNVVDTQITHTNIRSHDKHLRTGPMFVSMASRLLDTNSTFIFYRGFGIETRIFQRCVKRFSIYHRLRSIRTEIETNRVVSFPVLKCKTSFQPFARTAVLVWRKTLFFWYYILRIWTF